MTKMIIAVDMYETQAKVCAHPLVWEEISGTLKPWGDSNTPILNQQKSEKGPTW